MRIIPTSIHGLFDYVIGLALLFAPNLFAFEEVGGAATFVPRLVGALIILQSLFTRYELGLVKLISMRAHLAMDYVLAIFLAVSPWLFGFNQFANNVWMPHLIVGLAYLLIALLSQREPRVAYDRIER